MEPIPLPVIPVGDMEKTGLVILPELEMDQLDTVSFETREDVLHVTCFYDDTHSEDQREYPVEITESNRNIVETMEKIAVMDARQVEPEKLASHPEEQEKLEELMSAIRSPSGYTPLELSSSNGTSDDDPNTPGGSSP